MRVFLIIVAVLLVFAGGACALPSFVTYRTIGSDGFISGGGRMTTSAAAFVTGTAQFKEVTEEEVEEGRTGGDVLIRVRAQRFDGGEILVGIASDEALQSLVARGSNEIVEELKFDPFGYDSIVVGGARPLPAPEPGLFEVVSSGPGEQEVTWTVEPGEWRAVIMNPDGSPGVDVEAQFAARFPYLKGFAIAGMIIGCVIAAIGILWLAFLFRPGRNRIRPGPDMERPADEA